MNNELETTVSAQYLECPAEDAPRYSSVFLAGGITGVEDWQQKARTLLAGAPITMFNPRRAAFDVSNGDSAEQQIDWEYRKLADADVILFWFPQCDPKVTVQPIALYELGKTAALGKNMVVGTHPDYIRRTDVLEQLKRIRPDVQVRNTLEAVLDDARGCLCPF
jgi:Nucleoside 2-deoxyribosyltransferase like